MKLTQFPNRNTEPEDSLDLLCSQCFQNSMSLSSLFSLESHLYTHSHACAHVQIHKHAPTHSSYIDMHTHICTDPLIYKHYIYVYMLTLTHIHKHTTLSSLYLSKALFLKVDFNYRARNSQVLGLSLWASAPAQVQVWLHCSQRSSSHCLLNSRSPTKSYTQSMESFLPSIKDTFDIPPASTSSMLHLLFLHPGHHFPAPTGSECTSLNLSPASPSWAVHSIITH